MKTSSRACSHEFFHLSNNFEQKTQALRQKKQKKPLELQTTIFEERIAAEENGVEWTKSPLGRNPLENYHRLHPSNHSLELKHIESGKGERIEDHITTRTCQRKVKVTAKATKAFLRVSTQDSGRENLCRDSVDGQLSSPLPQTQPIISPTILTNFCFSGFLFVGHCKDDRRVCGAGKMFLLL